MNTALKRVLWGVLLLACLAAVWWGIRGQVAVGEPPVSAAPSVTGAAPSVSRPMDADAAGLMTGEPAPWDEISATPSHLEVYHDGERIIGAEVAHTRQNERGEIYPEPQTVGWYGPPEWGTTPGERSAYAGILAGHVAHSGLKDVFWRLDEVAEDDVVILTYDDGTQAAFRADTDVQSISKDGLIHDQEYAWAWTLPEVGNRITLFTCDLESGFGADGHSFNNRVVQARRVV